MPQSSCFDRDRYWNRTRPGGRHQESTCAATAHASAVVAFAQVAQPLGGLFRSQVPLGFGQQFVAHHEFLHGRRAEQRREEVRVQLPVGQVARVERGSVPTHGVRKGHLEEIVIAREHAFENLGQRGAFAWIEVRQTQYVPARQQQRPRVAVEPAQLVVARVERVEIALVDELDETERGAGGFGSTG